MPDTVGLFPWVNIEKRFKPPSLAVFFFFCPKIPSVQRMEKDVVVQAAGGLDFLMDNAQAREQSSLGKAGGRDSQKPGLLTEDDDNIKPFMYKVLCIWIYGKTTTA